MAYPDPQAAARRNLVRRIDQFMTGIETGQQPSVDAMDNLRVAIDCLEREDYPGGEDAMMLAEHGWAPRFPRTVQPRPIRELAESFERLRSEG